MIPEDTFLEVRVDMLTLAEHELAALFIENSDVKAQKVVKSLYLQGGLYEGTPPADMETIRYLETNGLITTAWKTHTTGAFSQTDFSARLTEHGENTAALYILKERHK